MVILSERVSTMRNGMLIRAIALSTVLASVVVTTACDDDSSPEQSSSGGTSGGSSGGTSGSTETDAGNDASGACNTLVNEGPGIPEEEVSGTPPTMTGGTLPDGTYILTKREDYDGSCNCSQRRKLVVVGNRMDIVTQEDENAPEVRATATLSFAGNEVTMTFTCGPAELLGKSMVLKYTVSAGPPTTYQTYDDNGGKSQLETYTKQ